MLWPIAYPPPAPGIGDKVLHIIAFVILVFPLAFSKRLGLLILFIAACAFGGAIELIQPIFGRSTDFNDWVADIIGVIVGIILGRTSPNSRMS